jgi:HAD superfamily phosphatase (TIGR01668 family)
MLRLFTPHLQLDSVLEIQPDTIHALGLEGLLLDLDCTLKDYHSNIFRPEVIEWVELMRREQVRMCLLTNGRPHRVEPLAEKLGIMCVSFAAKPLPRGIHAALIKLDLDRSRVAMVGDQIFADVIAGRLAGVFTILVRPTTDLEPWITHLKRPFERWVLRRIAQNAPKSNRAAAACGNSK